MSQLKDLFSQLLFLDVSAFGFPLKPFYLLVLGICVIVIKIAFKSGSD